MKFAEPKLWWPWELGQPNLYTLKLTAKIGRDISDVQSARFGIREVADYISPDGYRGYMVNGKKILIRGGGWADELLLRESHENLSAQLQLHQGNEPEHHPARRCLGQQPAAIRPRG